MFLATDVRVLHFSSSALCVFGFQLPGYQTEASAMPSPLLFSGPNPSHLPLERSSQFEAPERPTPRRRPLEMKQPSCVWCAQEDGAAESPQGASASQMF